ncbi:hypothetical protein [Bradyrhizobium sp. AS23.2]|uniref:hypothetical protein n=1 Tax=Bradyrhizobium sp. AS23.2 TaxID=1680155 RepID=UPI001161259D|nr:hypothetical protein [Bradyrhizobium sp. AS23.2]
MPLIRYFSLVGSALVLLLIGLGWCFPQPVREPLGSTDNGPVIRIASAERFPERVIIDTSLPTTVPPPSMVEFVERWPQEAVTAVDHASKVVPPTPVSEVSKRQNPAKQEPSRKVVAHRVPPKANLDPATPDKVPASPAVSRLSLLDILKEGVKQTQAKLIASFEPLSAHNSKSRSEMR